MRSISVWSTYVVMFSTPSLSQCIHMIYGEHYCRSSVTLRLREVVVIWLFRYAFASVRFIFATEKGALL
ncbi:hypothetical protein DAEQUDRAFT_234705 [Daedalea quercina L-15889]|uniref:Uncharacterized protein n=1 Tax=Daedalea quercina L-15889 TaxID=1314783 RepID=A0A165QVG4_9APHY|nr:hypothetical protein DAEQUDRAFT_234705 [Daedalea quercina L-15889]